MEKQVKKFIIATCISIMFLSPIFSGAHKIEETKQDLAINIENSDSQKFNTFLQKKIPFDNPLIDQRSQNNYPDNNTIFLDFVITDNKDYVICGSSGNSGCSRAFLLKTDSSGNELWCKRYNTIRELGFDSIDETLDKGYILTGNRKNDITNSDEITLLKTDKDGNKQWLKSYNQEEHIRSNSVISTSNGNFVVFGTKGYDNKSFFLLKTDANGDKLWYKTYEKNISYITLYSKMIESDDNGYVLSGTIEKGNNSDLILLKVDENGNEMWKEEYHIFNHTIAFDLDETSKGNLICIGYSLKTINHSSPYYMFIMKTNECGKEYWIRTYADSAALSVDETDDGGFIISGFSFIGSTGAFLKKINNNGIDEWINYYDDISSFFFFHIEQTSDPGYIICGYVLDQDYFGILVKTNNLGQLDWYKTYNYSDVDVSYVTFYGWDTSNTIKFVKIQACNRYISISNGGQSLEYYETDKIPTCPGTYDYKITWYGSEGSDTITGTFTLDVDEHKKIINNLTFCDDLPQIEIIKPGNGIYAFNNKIAPFFFPIVIGPIDITAEVYDNSSEINYVEYYVDDIYVTKDYTEPYILPIKLPFLRKSNVKIKAFDTWGYNATKEISIWSI